LASVHEIGQYDIPRKLLGGIDLLDEPTSHTQTGIGELVALVVSRKRSVSRTIRLDMVKYS
jgi:hypothetical protein